MLKGDPEKSLINPNDVVLTEETSKRYFGSEDAIGKTLQIFGQDFSVSGVCDNVPENSHLKFDFLIKWSDNFFGGHRSCDAVKITLPPPLDS